MKTKHISFIMILILLATCLTSCAPKHYTGSEYGFFSGIWHGLIVVFSIVGKIFGFDIGIYAENNSGFFYWLGFLIGIGGLGGGASSAR